MQSTIPITQTTCNIKQTCQPKNQTWPCPALAWSVWSFCIHFQNSTLYACSFLNKLCSLCLQVNLHIQTYMQSHLTRFHQILFQTIHAPYLSLTFLLIWLRLRFIIASIVPAPYTFFFISDHYSINVWEQQPFPEAS